VLCCIGLATGCRPDDDLRWSTALTGRGEATAVALTRAGIIVAGGWYDGELSAGATVLQPAEFGTPRVFVARLNPDGGVSWLTDLGLQGFGWIEDAAAVDDDVYVVGSFAGALGSTSSTGHVDAFVARVSPSDGSTPETFVFGGTGRQRISSITVMSDGDVLITGDFTEELSIGQKRASAAGGSDGFVARVSLPGSCRWVETLSGPGDDTLRAATVSGSRVALAGAHSDSAVWQGTSAPSVGLSDLFIALISPDDGSSMWSATIGSVAGDLANDVAITDDGTVWVAGLAAGRLSAEPSRASDGTGDALLASFTPAGERASLAVFGALGFDEATALVARADSQFVALGDVRGSVNFGRAHATSANDTSDGFLVSPSVDRFVLIDRGHDELFRAAVPNGRDELIASGSSGGAPWVAALRVP
jgi:hypothetical protein